MDWPTKRDRAISNLFDKYPPDRDYREWFEDQLDFAKDLALVMSLPRHDEDWSDGDIDWRFPAREERPMSTPTRSHHKKPPVTQIPDTGPRVPPLPKADPPMTPGEYQDAVLAKLDEIILRLDEMLAHARGQ